MDTQDMQMDELRGNAKDYQRKLEELFRAADADGNGSLSAEEFVEAMSLPSVQHYLQAKDLKIYKLYIGVTTGGHNNITCFKLSAAILHIISRLGSHFEHFLLFFACGRHRWFRVQGPRS